MDDSMNSVHSVSAMDISPASSPIMSVQACPLNQFVMNALIQQQKALPDRLTAPKLSEQKLIHSDEQDQHSQGLGLFSSTRGNQMFQEMRSPVVPDESNELRQRINTDPLSSVVDSTPSAKQLESTSTRRPLGRIAMLLLLTVLIPYLTVSYLSSPVAIHRSTNWQNASDYLSEHLIGQEQGLRDFQEAINKHINFSVVLMEGPTGTGKTYLASSLEKFIPTTLLSINTLLGLPAHHWNDSARLSSYFSSHLSPSAFQVLILDDLDLLPNTEHSCQIFTTALQSMSNHKNLFILLLQTNAHSSSCREQLSHIATRSIRFHHLQRDDLRRCIHNEAYIQNVQPPLTDSQIENILNSLTYIDDQGLRYSTTGCKQIPSLVMNESKKS